VASIAFTVERYGANVLRLSWSTTGAAFYYVYIDGVLAAIVNRLWYQFSISRDEQVQVEVCDSSSDVPAVAYPGNALLTWQGDTEAAYYLIQQYVGSAWTTVRTVQETGAPFYQYRSAFLDDCTTHQFRVVPVNTSEIQGTPKEFTFLVVRYPDAPSATYTYDSEDNLLSIAV
jgi:hypothetical protein